MKIALISCSSKKKSGSCKAKHLYDGDLFKKSMNYVKNRYDKWFILSAKYGLLNPDDIISGYDLSLNSLSKNELSKWSKNISEKILKLNPDEIDFYCGVNYRKYLIDILKKNNIKCNSPLEGLGIGKQLKFYKNNIQKGFKI